MLTFRLHRTTTGAPLSVPIRARGRANMSMTSFGTGSHAVPLEGTKYGPAQWHDVTRHWWNTLAVCWNDWPIYAGPIRIKRYSPARKLLTLETVTVDALLRDRLPFGVGAYDQGDFQVVSKSLRGALTQILRQVSTEGPSPSPYHSLALPFRFSHDGEAGGFSKLWAARDWATAADIVDFIQRLDGGPDVAFVPMYDEAKNLFWDVRIGDPNVAGTTIDVPLSVRKSPASNLEIIEDGSKMISGLFLRGEGGGDDRTYGQAGDFDDLPGDRPLMTIRDSVRSEASTKDVDLLNSMALAQLKVDRFPTRQIELSLVTSGGAFSPRDVTLGTRLNLRHSGDEYLEPFSSTQYVVAFTHDTDQPHLIRPEVQTL